MTAPIIRRLIPGDGPIIERFLLPRMERSMFLLSNLLRTGLADDGSLAAGSWVGAFDRDALVAVAAHSNFGTLLSQAPVHLEPILRELLRLTTRPIKGVVSIEAQAAPIIDLLGFPTEGPAVQFHSRQGLYALPLDELSIPPGLAEARISVRRADEADHAELLRLRIGFLVEEIGYRDTDEARCKAETDLKWVLPHCWVVEDPVAVSTACPAARPSLVAMTGFNATTPTAVQVGSVYTDPAHRSRGYARAAVAASLLDARERGVERAILFTADANTAARRAYAALGFRRIDDFRILLLREPIEPDILTRRLGVPADPAAILP